MQDTSRTLRLTITTLFGFSLACSAQEPSVSILGDAYRLASSSELNGSSAHEFVKSGESIENWTRLLTIQCHPSARRVGDVLNPYLKDRKNVLLSMPIFIQSPNDGKNGLVLIATLGEKGAETFEFVVARFVQKPPELGVTAIMLSEKHLVAKEVQIESGKSIEAALKDFDLNLAQQACQSDS